MPPPPDILTPRLRLVAATAELAAAAVADRARFARLLRAEVTPEWPPWVLADHQDQFAATLAAHPDQAGWWSWYVVGTDRSLVPQDTLVGSAGGGAAEGTGPPDGSGIVLIGYSTLPAYEGRGIATEAARGFIRWASEFPATREFQATTFERHHASCRILAKCGFELVGVSPDDARAAESDRQGRGRLLVFRRPR